MTMDVLIIGGSGHVSGATARAAVGAGTSCLDGYARTAPYPERGYRVDRGSGGHGGSSHCT